MTTHAYLRGSFSRRSHVHAIPRHPRGSQARVLLSSVFGPFARDDEYGSRAVNPMELYHNQVTRLQGPFSLRMFHGSWGLMLIQANVSARCALLDFPSRARFIEALQREAWDVIGLGAIPPNVGKVKEMCRLIRLYRPGATIVVGGHVASVPGLERLIDADHVVRGEGVAWFREFLGDEVDAPLKHPVIRSGFGARAMGVPLGDAPEDTAATLIPSVGCPLGCNFCATSALFGGKGRFVHFYETGDELFDVMEQLEEASGTQSFFVMDENFLFHRRRALRLLELMKEHDKSWSLYVFSSANVLKLYSVDELVGLGISWVWIGLEGEESRYAKLKNADTRALVRRLQDQGIRVLGSTIIGLEHHSLDNIDAAIDYAVAHDTEFHQFMLYTPVPGTPLHAEHQAKGTLLSDDEVPLADAHGQLRFKHRHPHLPAGAETELLLRAFRRDFEVNGPSVMRVVRTQLKGWLAHKHHPDARVRRRFEREAKGLGTTWAAGLWAARRWFSSRNPAVAARLDEVLQQLFREFGPGARLAAATLGPVVAVALWREERALARGATREPATSWLPQALPSVTVRPAPAPVLELDPVVS
ncbi:MAG: cobalamin-dependent protein [Myxococcaceae bacterium]|nr:cobalamin-dependent protein [Myxococcaceae bacterium]